MVLVWGGFFCYGLFFGLVGVFSFWLVFFFLVRLCLPLFFLSFLITTLVNIFFKNGLSLNIAA